MSCFVYRNVTYCQNIFRDVKVITQQRMAVLDEIFERSLEVLYFHIGIMISGKPLASIDPNKLESVLLPSDPLCIRCMAMLDCHAYLRNILSSNESVLAMLKTTRRERMAGKWAPEAYIKEAVLRKLLTEKKRNHAYKSKVKHVPRYV